jgi:peptidoglycan/LPS O-acetylase OafA/YrhL
MERLTHLDGLRGLAAFAVLLCHLVSSFFPLQMGTFFLFQTPFEIFFSGGLAVSVFFCLSGFVLSIKFIQEKRIGPLFPLLVKRYIRLALPVLLSVLLACFLLTNSFVYNQTIGRMTQSTEFLMKIYTFQPSWIDALVNGFFSAFLPMGTQYNVVLWTMAYEFVGSCIIYSLLVVFSIFHWKYRGYFYLGLGVLFINSFFLCFIVGMVCAEVYANELIKVTKIQCFVLFLSAIYLGTYPQGLPTVLFIPLNAMMGNLPAVSLPRDTFAHILSATLLLITVLYSVELRSLLSSRFCRFLGRVSFSLYLVHISLICSFSSLFFLLLVENFHVQYGYASLITCIVSVPVILAISALFAYADEWSVHISHLVQIHLESLLRYLQV